ncbi:MAG: retropepsin-like aspartic protease, partial [Thermonemataceae bacterium]|nr:retropepsin-like aspartic protease [Thermonemataceae bacterium]
MQKKIYIICSLLLLSIFYTHFAFGQGVAGFQFSKPKQKFARIPFQLHNNLIIIPVLLNQSKDTLRFILDTGVGNTILIDSSFIKKLAIDTQSRKVFIKGSGLGEQISTYIAPLQKMSVQQLIAPNTNILVCEKTLTYISEYAGITIHGIVGYDFFANLVVTIDYEQKELRVFNVEYFNKKAKKIPENQLYPIQIQKKKPYIKASISYDISQNIPIQLLMDTGAGHSLSLDE